ncbi:MAG TPA: hypothetical protein VLF93_07455 [Candidatus Saccharimonadales bacterium]|nr:hypothetical protein [Candidatus Saccharimonadales bacterium]
MSAEAFRQIIRRRNIDTSAQAAANAAAQGEPASAAVDATRVPSRWKKAAPILPLAGALIAGSVPSIACSSGTEGTALQTVAPSPTGARPIDYVDAVSHPQTYINTSAIRITIPAGEATIVRGRHRSLTTDNVPLIEGRSEAQVTGVLIRMDGGEPGKVLFALAPQNGDRSESQAEETLIAKLKHGQPVTVTGEMGYADPHSRFGKKFANEGDPTESVLVIEKAA